MRQSARRAANDHGIDASALFDAGPSSDSFMHRAWTSVPPTVVKSAGRALQILEFFDDAQRPAGMTEISRALGYPESSTSILLRSLMTLGYLDYDRYGRTYCPTGRVRLLGNWIAGPLFKNNRISELMNRLNAEIEDTIILAKRNGLFAQYIHVVQARTTLRIHLTPGTMRPITRSMSGLVMLSHLSDGEVARIVRRANAEAESPEDIVSPSHVLQQVATIRRDGFVFGESQVTAGCSMASFVLPTKLSESPLALGVGAPSVRFGGRYDRVVALVKSCIKELFLD